MHATSGAVFPSWRYMTWRLRRKTQSSNTAPISWRHKCHFTAQQENSRRRMCPRCVGASGKVKKVGEAAETFKKKVYLDQKYTSSFHILS